MDRKIVDASNIIVIETMGNKQLIPPGCVVGVLSKTEEACVNQPSTQFTV